MATKTLMGAQFSHNLDGGVPGTVMDLPEGSGQSWTAGSWVSLASGFLVAAKSGDAYIGGQAVEAASTTQYTKRKVRMIRKGDVLYGSVYHGTSGSAVTAHSQRGSTFDMVISSGAMYVDIEHTSDNILQVLFLGSDVETQRNTVGDVYGYVYFVVVDSAIQTA